MGVHVRWLVVLGRVVLPYTTSLRQLIKLLTKHEPYTSITMVIIFVITATLDNDFDSMLAKDTLQSVQ